MRGTDSVTEGCASNSPGAGNVSARAAVSGPGAGAAASARASSSCRRKAICDTAASRLSRGFGAGSLAGLSRPGPAGVDRFQLPDCIDQRLPIAVARRIRPLEDLGDRFRTRARPALLPARASLRSARSPNQKKWESRVLAVHAPLRLAARCVRGVPRPRRAARRRLQCLRAGRVPRARPGRSLRLANRQAACQRDGPRLQRRPESAAPPPRSSAPSLCSCPRPSAAANRRALKLRGAGQLFRRSW